MDLEVLPKHFIGRNLDSILGHSSKVWCRSGAGWVVVGRQLAKDGHQNFRILCHVENICPWWMLVPEFGLLTTDVSTLVDYSRHDQNTPQGHLNQFYNFLANFGLNTDFPALFKNLLILHHYTPYRTLYRTALMMKICHCVIHSLYYLPRVVNNVWHVTHYIFCAAYNSTGSITTSHII